MKRSTAFLLVIGAFPSLLACGTDGLIDLAPDSAPSANDASSDAALPQPSCVGPSDCVSPYPECDLHLGECVECVSSDTCGERFCEPESHSCVDCVQDIDCGDELRCSPERWNCVECLSEADCEEGVCDPTGRCTESCQGDQDCHEDSEPWCLPTGGFCVECTASDQCESDEQCDPSAHRCL